MWRGRLRSFIAESEFAGEGARATRSSGTCLRLYQAHDWAAEFVFSFYDFVVVVADVEGKGW
jgi:hypothetical protein